MKITGGEDQSYFFNSWVAGSSPAGPKGNRSSMAEQRKHTLVAGSPVITFLFWPGHSRLRKFTKGWSGICCNGRSHNRSFTLEQVSSVVKTRVTSPVRRCGPGHLSRANTGAIVSRPNPAGISSAVVSNLERRTITPGSIVPRL